MKIRQRSQNRVTLRAVAAASLLACGPLVGVGAQAALSFTYNFQDGFVGNAGAQQAVVTAGNLFSEMFATHFSNTATIDFDVKTLPTGVASAATYSAVGPGFGTGEFVRNKVLTGVDLNGSDTDGVITVNLGLNYQFNPNAPVDFAGGQLDFFSVLDHELTHALGFFSGGTTTNDQALSKFDQFLTTTAGVSLWDPITGLRNAAAFQSASTSTALFNGPNTVARYGSPASVQGVAATSAISAPMPSRFPPPRSTA